MQSPEACRYQADEDAPADADRTRKRVLQSFRRQDDSCIGKREDR